MPIEVLFLIFGLAALVGTVIGLAIGRREKRRAKEIQSVGYELGLTYFPKGDPAWFSALSWREKLAFSCLNTLHGQTDDLVIRLFEHFYMTGVGPLKFPRRQTMIIFQSSALNHLPAFSLRPHTSLYRIASLFFGNKRIEFESHPSFSHTLLLCASEEAQIRQVFDDDTLTFFEQGTNDCIYLENNSLLVYRKGVRVKPTEIRSFLDEGFAVYRLLLSRTSVASQDDSRLGIGEPATVADLKQHRPTANATDGSLI